MDVELEKQDRALVQRCLSGTKEAWEEFYARFTPLVRKAVTMYLPRKGTDVEDIVQDVFITLYTGLKGYEEPYSVSKFVWLLAKRVCIDNYRGSKRIKRNGTTVPVDHHDGDQEAGKTLESCVEGQEQLLGRAQLIEILKQSFRHLGEKCRTLLNYRYFEELPFSEIASKLGANKKSLAVQAVRCVNELRAKYAKLMREGLRS